jgi:hypothetical protein
MPATAKPRSMADVLADAQRDRARTALSNEAHQLCERLAGAEPVVADAEKLIELAVKAYALGTDPNADEVSATARTRCDVNVTTGALSPTAVVLSEPVLWLLTASRARIRLASGAAPVRAVEFVPARDLSPSAVAGSFTSAMRMLDRHVASLGVITQPTKRTVDRIAHYHLHLRFLWHICLADLAVSPPAAEPWRLCAIRRAIDRAAERSRNEPTFRTRIGDSIRVSLVDLGEYARTLVDSPDDARALGIQVAFQRCALHDQIGFRAMSIDGLVQYDRDASDICVYEALFSTYATPPSASSGGRVERTVRAGVVNLNYEFSQYVVRFGHWGAPHANAVAQRSRVHGRPALPVIYEVGRGKWGWAVVDRTARTYTFVSTALAALAEWEYRVQHFHDNTLERVVVRPLVHDGACGCVQGCDYAPA